MNGDSPESPPWSRQRWVALVLAVFALHLGALFLISSRSEKVQRRADSRAAVRWLTDPASARKTLDALLLNDPTLLAMASPRGFSGAAWMRPQSPEYRVSEWTDTERSLAQPTNSLGGAFQQFAGTSQSSIFDPARKPVAPPATVAAAQPALRNASRLRVEGPASRRPIIQPPALRSWPHADVLADSRVQVFVTDEGLIFSPRLAGGGVKTPAQRAADDHALDLARAIRFEPLPKSTGSRSVAHVEATLVFEWHTTAPPAPPAKP